MTYSDDVDSHEVKTHVHSEEGHQYLVYPKHGPNLVHVHTTTKKAKSQKRKSHKLRLQPY